MWSGMVNTQVKTQEGLQPPGLDSKAETEIPTQAYKTMWHHLNSKLRRQPVIGLRTIVEYHEDNQAPYLMCEACATRIPQGFIVGHLISAEHRYKYIKSLHPKLINGWKDDPDFLEYQDALEEKAKCLEMKEGLGDIQIMKKGKAGFEVVVLPPPDKYHIHEWAAPKTSVNLPIKGEHEGSHTEPGEVQNLVPNQVFDQDGRMEVNFVVTVKEELAEDHVTDQLSASHCGSADNHMVLRDPTVAARQNSCPYYGMTNKMEPVVAEGTWPKVALCGPSHRSAFASKYLSEKRIKTIIGLRAVVECQAAKVPPFYVCNVCRAKFSFCEVFNHVQSNSHCFSYIRSQYPQLLEKFGAGPKSIKPSRPILRSIAKELCRIESMGDTLVIKLDLHTYRKLQKMSTREAMNKLQIIMKNQDNHQDAVNSKKTVGILQGQMKVEEKPRPIVAQRAEVSSVKKQNPALPHVQGQVTHPSAEDWVEKVQTKHPHMPVVGRTLPVPIENVKIASHSEREAFVPRGRAMLAQPLRKFEMKKVFIREEVTSKQVILPAPAVDSQILRIKKTGVPMDESHLAKFMLPFLSGKAHPVIGLGKIVECRSFKEPTFYLCLSCSQKLEKASICEHIVHWHHQYWYMRLEHPHLLKGCDEGSTMVNTTYLVKLAHTLMSIEGMGHPQVIKLDRYMYQKVASASFDAALEKLKIQRDHCQGELQPQMTFRPRLAGPQISVQWQQPYRVPISDSGGPNKPQEIYGVGAQHKALLGKRTLQEHLSSLREDPSVLGLQFVLECRCVEDDSCPYYYLCQACSLRLEEDQIVEHLRGSFHQFYYIVMLLHKDTCSKLVMESYGSL